MESINTPSLQNHDFYNNYHQQMLSNISNNSTLHQDIVNASDEINNFATIVEPVPSVATFLICLTGIPGNLLVIAVYAWKMTTSIRVYLFALAVADLVACICGIVLTTVTFDYITLEVTTYCVNMSVTFSLVLLTFVSIERLLAVRRPHTFSLSSLRAKRALVVIAVVAALCTVVLTVARIKRYALLVQILPAIGTVTNVMVMMVCYSLMAIKMLMNARNAHRNVGVARNTPAPGPSTVPSVTYFVPNVKATVDVASSKNISLSRITEDNYKTG